MNSGRFQQLKQYFFSWRETIFGLVTQNMNLPSFKDLFVRNKKDENPKVETTIVKEEPAAAPVASALPSFDTLPVKSQSDSVTSYIDKQVVQALQYGAGGSVGTLDHQVAEPLQTHAAWPFPVGEVATGLEQAQPTEKKRNPRRRLAKPITEFRAQAGKGHALFYRYLRIPDRNNSYEPGPKGGAAILVDLIDSSKLVFSFAVCSPKDPFIKDEARRLCQERFLHDDTCTVEGRDDFFSCFENIGVAIRNCLDNDFAEAEPKLIINSPRVTEQQLKLLLKAIDSWSPVGQ